MLCIYISFNWLWGSLSLRFIRQTRKSIVGDSCDVSVPRDPSVKITPKTSANFASLNSSIAFGDLRLGGCLRAPCSQAPARAQSPARNTRIKRRKIRKSFWGYFDGRIPGYGDVARVAHDGFTCLPDETERESPTPQPIKKKYIQSNLFSYNALL